MTLEEIENLLYETSGNRTWLDLMAPQEIERLVFLVQESLSKAESPGGDTLNYEKFIQVISTELKEYADVFGVKDLDSRLHWQEFLKKLSVVK